MVDDEEIIHQTIGVYLRNLGHQVVEQTDGKSALKTLEKDSFDLALVDIRMPEMDGLTLLHYIHDYHLELPVIMISGHGDMESVIQSLRQGAVDFLTKPVKLIELEAHIERSLILHHIKKERSRLLETVKGIQTADARNPDNTYHICESPAMQRVYNQIKQVREANVDSILITGETGTGKEIVARSIHFQASSYQYPFIAVSCPTLVDTLIESELFGHVKGSFTGSTRDKTGYFEMAHGGTLFLDEVSDLTPAAQASLLRVIETRQLRRVGDSREIKVEVRLIAATSASLEKRVREGNFREDLFYRLNVFPIHIEPLHRRLEDIIPLAEHFLSSFASNRHLDLNGFSEDAQKSLLEYDYPGNVRELRYLIERSAILCRSGTISLEHLNMPVRAANPTPSLSAIPAPGNERDQLLKALEHTRWNRRQTARDLGIPYSTLMYKLKKFGIK